MILLGMLMDTGHTSRLVPLKWSILVFFCFFFFLNLSLLKGNTSEYTSNVHPNVPCNHLRTIGSALGQYLSLNYH